MTPTNEIVRETIQARHTYTTLEAVEESKKLTGEMAQLRRIDEEFDSVKAQFKSRKAVCEEAISMRARNVEQGFEMRPVLAQVVFNAPEPGRKSYYHDLTGEFIREEAMTYDDQQRPLFKSPDGGDATATITTAEDIARAFVLDKGKTVEDPDGNAVELETPPPAATNLGDALGAAAAKTDAPQFVLDIDKDDWTRTTLKNAFKKSAAKVGWAPVQIDTLAEVLKECDSVKAMISTLRPHVIVPAPQGHQAGDIVDAEGVECPECGSVSFDGAPCDCKTGANPDAFTEEETTD